MHVLFKVSYMIKSFDLHNVPEIEVEYYPNGELETQAD